MIAYKKHSLSNGLTLIIHEDSSTPMVVVNTLFNIGAKHEDPTKTGFAHLFEHLMFGGSENIEKFDKELEKIGGYSNAYTNNDVTNYYDLALASNLETILWLESDRLNQLKFSKDRLKNQQDVVIEEFKQRYLNTPYGDLWLLLFPLIFGEDNYYGWPTIGKKLEHISDAQLEYVEKFFYTFYRPENTILSIAGNITEEKTLNLVEKWYNDIPQSTFKRFESVPQKKLQGRKFLDHYADVPSNAILISFKTVSRNHADFYVYELLTDILSGDLSSPLYQTLVKEKQLCSSAGAFHVDFIEDGFITVYAYANDGVKLEKLEEEIWNVLENIDNEITQRSITKVKNIAAKNNEYQYISIQDRAEDLAYFELVESADIVNNQLENILKVSSDDIFRVSKNVFSKDNHAIIYYNKKK